MRPSTTPALIRVHGPWQITPNGLAGLEEGTDELDRVGIRAQLVRISHTARQHQAVVLVGVRFVFQGLLGYGELAFFVPVASAILLLALGADYNVFLISRIWRAADDRELRPAIRRAGVRAGRAITVAGFILALSFAAIALIPIQGFREIALALCVGLLLDTLLARTLRVPALVAIFERGNRGNEACVERAAGDTERRRGGSESA